MDFRQLSNFVLVVEKGSISAAAREIHVAQPPLSRQMTALEEELGVPLFVRTNQGVVLTEAGEQFYHQSRLILTNLEQMKTGVQEIGKGVVGQLRLGILFSVGPMIAPYVAAYHRTYPEVKIHVRYGTAQDLLDALFKAEIDVVFLRSPVLIPRELKSFELGTDELVLIVTKALDPVPERNYVTVEELKQVPFCLLEHNERSGYNDYLLRACARFGFYPETGGYGNDEHSVLELVAAGFGVGYLPGSVLDTHLCRMNGMYGKGIEGLQVFSPVSMVWDDTAVTPHCVSVFADTICARVSETRAEGEYYEIRRS